jgi:hypothetical protein
MSKRPRLAEDARRGAFTGEEIAALVRKYHEIGKKLLEPATKPSARQAKPDLTGISGPSSASLRVYQNEYRRFAGAYTVEELEELLKLRTKKEGTPLGWGIVRKLMAVPDKTMRRKLELRAANESWSVRQADAIVRERVFKTKRSKGARPLAEPKNLTELLQRLEMHVGESRRRLSHWTESHILNRTPSIMKVGESLRARVLAIRHELKILGRTAKDLSSKLESIAADGPELGKEAPHRAVEAQSMKKPS